MRIDPVPFVLDANDRCVLKEALLGYTEKLSDLIARAHARTRQSDRVRAEIESMENKRARAEDLLNAMRA